MQVRLALNPLQRLLLQLIRVVVIKLTRCILHLLLDRPCSIVKFGFGNYSDISLLVRSGCLGCRGSEVEGPVLREPRLRGVVSDDLGVRPDQLQVEGTAHRLLLLLPRLRHG